MSVLATAMGNAWITQGIKMLKIAEQIALAEDAGFSSIVVPITEAKMLLEGWKDYHRLLREIAGTEKITHQEAPYLPG